MDDPVNEASFEIMTEVITGAVNTPRNLALLGGTFGAIMLMELRDSTAEKVGNPDLWQAKFPELYTDASIASQTIDGKYTPPHESASFLTEAAFDDVNALTELAEFHLVHDYNINEPSEVGSILYTSKPDLLKIARLKERDKNQLLQRAQRIPMLRQAVEKHPDPPIYDSDHAFELHTDDHGQLRLRWQPSTVEWIDKKIGRHHGCPAMSETISIGGLKRNLLFAFWDLTLDYRYGQRENQPIAPAAVADQQQSA